MIEISEELFSQIEESAANTAEIAKGALCFLDDAVEHFGDDPRYYAVRALLTQIEQEATRGANLCDEATM